MPRRGYPPEFRRKVLDLVEAGRTVAAVARDLGISDQSIYSWRRQDRVDKGLIPGLSMPVPRPRRIVVLARIPSATNGSPTDSGYRPAAPVKSQLLGLLGDAFDLSRNREPVHPELTRHLFAPVARAGDCGPGCGRSSSVVRLVEIHFWYWSSV